MISEPATDRMSPARAASRGPSQASALLRIRPLARGATCECDDDPRASDS